MPTARFSAELRAAEVRAAVADVGHLLRFRAQTVRRPRRAALALVLLVVVSVVAAVVPAWVGVAVEVRADLRRMLPALLVAVAFVSVASAVAGGGGRELLARYPAAVHPVNPVTDHLGALLLAPLNAGWLIQTWAVLVLAAGAVAGALPDLRGVLVAAPARWTADAVTGTTGQAVAISLVVVAVALAVVVLGGWLGTRAARRAPRDEARLESRSHAARPTPRSDLTMRRIDRASVWRSVPLRRGTYLLALAPGWWRWPAGSTGRCSP